MKLYLSSYRIPVPEALSELLGKPLQGARVALLPNAQDYYEPRARGFKVGSVVSYMEERGLKVTVVDLRDYDDPQAVKAALQDHDLIWAMGGNTYMLRYEMQRSGFDQIIRELLEAGIVYGGDSAGALVAGQSIAGVESADEPEFAAELVTEGLNFVPSVILPHVDNPEFTDVLPIFTELHKDKDIIQLKDSQAVIYDGDTRRMVDAGDGDAEHKLPTEELDGRLAEAAEQVTVGERYWHYKGLEYTVLHLALREENNEVCVVYQAEYKEKLVWVRPLASWLEEVSVDGQPAKRFTKLTPLA